MDSLTGKRVAIDVSVLLAGLLDANSASARLLSIAKGATLVLSEHVEERARLVLRAAAPQMVGEFNDGLLRLAMHTTIDRVARQSGVSIPPWAEAKLCDEDLEVLSGAVAGESNWLFTHDHDFFKGSIPGIQVYSPGSFVWDPLAGENVERGSEAFTFLGWFYPQWSTAAVAGSRERFYVFEVDGYACAFYDARDSAFHVRWNKRPGVSNDLKLPLTVGAYVYNFVAVTCGKDHVSLLVNGETRSRKTHLGVPPATTTFHPFMSAQSMHQITGGCQFRMVGSALSEKTIRRHLLAHSVRLSDGELRFAEWADRSSLLLSAGEGRLVARPT